MNDVLKVLLLSPLLLTLMGCQTYYLGMLFDDHEAPYQEYLAEDNHYKAFMVAEWRTEDSWGDWQMTQHRINEFGKETPEEVIQVLYDYCETVKAANQTCRLYALGNQRVWALHKPASFEPMIRAYKKRLGSSRVVAIAKKFQDKRQSLDLGKAIERQQSRKKSKQPKAQIETPTIAAPPQKRQSLADLASQMEVNQASLDQNAPNLSSSRSASVTEDEKDASAFKEIYESKAQRLASIDGASAITADMLAWKDIGKSVQSRPFQLFIWAFEDSPFTAIARAKLEAMK